jgi:hypothetical protein
LFPVVRERLTPEERQHRDAGGRVIWQLTLAGRVRQTHRGDVPVAAEGVA